MACCKCCCGKRDCEEGDAGKCCCGDTCCQEGEYCCNGECKQEACCPPNLCFSPGAGIQQFQCEGLDCECCLRPGWYLSVTCVYSCNGCVRPAGFELGVSVAMPLDGIEVVEFTHGAGYPQESIGLKGPFDTFQQAFDFGNTIDAFAECPQPPAFTPECCDGDAQVFFETEGIAVIRVGTCKAVEGCNPLP